jgi:hypothetical protein
MQWVQNEMVLIRRNSISLKYTDHCSSEKYRCTHVDACVARTWKSYRCVPCHTLCTHRTSLVVKKKTFSVFLWLWTIPLGKVLWFSCYKYWYSRRTLWNALYFAVEGIIGAHRKLWDPILFTGCALNNYKSFLSLKYCWTGCSVFKTLCMFYARTPCKQYGIP